MRSTSDFITSTRKIDQDPISKDFVTVIILGENYGHRMKSYGPVPLINIDGKTLLGKQISAIRSTFKNYEIVLCTGFDADKVASIVKEKFADVNIRMVENQIHLNSNCCESVRLCLNNVSNNKVIILGGGIEITSKHLEMLDIDKNEVMIQKQENDENFEIGAIVLEDDILGHLTFGVYEKYWTEILCLSGEKSISSFRNIIKGVEYKNRFLFEAINNLSNEHSVNVKINTKSKIMKIDNIKTLRKTSKL